MTSVIVHGFHRLRSFWSGPKGPKRPPEPRSSGPPAIPPGFLNAAAIRGILTGNYIRLSGATAVFRPEKKPRFSASWPQMTGRVYLGQKSKRKPILIGI